MRNLILFFIKYNGVFVFLLLQILCFVLIASSSRYHQTFFLNSANKISGSFYENITSVRDYIGLRKVNDSLAAENAKLRNQLQGAVEYFVFVQDSVRDTVTQQLYEYTSAKIVRKTLHQPNNYLTLNIGSAHGISPESGVIGPNGIVGIVKDVSRNFSTVLTLIHQNFRIHGLVTRNNTAGDIRWYGEDPSMAVMENVPKHVELRVGDSVVTSGYSSMFPEGEMIGTIAEVNASESLNFYDIKVKLATDFYSLRYVYIINYLMKAEREEIENPEDG